MLGGNAELWVRGDGNPILAPTMDSVKKFYLFNPESMEWETVSANVLQLRKRCNCWTDLCLRYMNWNDLGKECPVRYEPLK